MSDISNGGYVHRYPVGLHSGDPSLRERFPILAVLVTKTTVPAYFAILKKASNLSQSPDYLSNCAAFHIIKENRKGKEVKDILPESSGEYCSVSR
jgi:hypothetical protein